MPTQEYLIVDHLSLKDIARIFAKIVVDPVTGCWEWQGKRNKGGYGCIKFRRRDESQKPLNSVNIGVNRYANTSRGEDMGRTGKPGFKYGETT